MTMLRVDLGQLRREGSVTLEASIPADDGLWHDTDLKWAEDLNVRVRASFAGTGEVVARGSIRGTLLQECRRCLEEVRTSFDEDVTMVFEENADEEGGTFLLEPEGNLLDLSEAVREEVILAVDPYVVCDSQCRGLCPRCGTNLNEGSCDCVREEPDPRWAALRNLQSE